MDRPRGALRGAGGATLEACLAEAAAGKPEKVYLFDGDEFLALRAARALAHALVKEPARSLNLVELDAAASPEEVAAELSTAGLFGGAKVVVVVDPAFLTSREDAALAFESAAKAFSEGRQREGARRLLALFGKAGLGQKALTVGPDGRVARETKDALFLELSVPSEPGAEAFIDAAARYAAERDLKVAKGDDALALDAAISRGFPPGHVLIVAAGKVDGRLPLVKKLAAAGRRVTTALAKEGPRDSDRLLLSPLLESLLAGTGKRVDRAGEVALGERVGEDARVLASEVEKLRAYVGDRKVIGKADVLAVVARVAPDPFFALGNAVEGRDLREALSVLDRSIADGVSPFLLLASLAGTVRRLLVEQERGRQVAEGRRIGSYEEWSTLALPTIRKEELGSRKPYGIWKKYQASLRFTRDELMDALCGLARADLGMKSGQDERMGLEQVLFGLLAKERVERSGP